MKFINNSIHPALSFEGIDQLDQEFHVIVMRQTYTWDDRGLLQLLDEQDSLCMMDELVESSDIMSGVLEESDLCHYKPKVDILVQGHAYRPDYRKHKSDYKASLKVQTPEKIIYKEAIAAGKHEFAAGQQKTSKKGDHIKGQTIIDKTLMIIAPSYAQAESESIMGNIRYLIKTEELGEKTTLNPSSTFGGYSIIEENSNAYKQLEKIHPELLIAKEDRDAICLNPEHKKIAYFHQDSHNPYGSGYRSPEYHNCQQPKQIILPQIHQAGSRVTESMLNKMSKKALNTQTHAKLVAGFGVRTKSHPQRHQYLGEINQEFIDSDKVVPEGFDFAIWNSAYPDQQVEKLAGNEWITLTNLCHPDTIACKKTDKGDTELTLYLPEQLAYVLTNSNRVDMVESEVPMKLDTVIVSPDEHKASLVWRGLVSGDYDPKTIFLETADRAKQSEMLKQFFTQKGEIVRPYEHKEQ